MIDEALRVVASGRHEELSIRGLAAELGVAPMSLYRHVKNKDDLLSEVVDRLLERTWRPEISPNPWQGWIVDAAERLRRFLVVQPVALHVYLQHPVASPSAITRMNEMLRVLRSAGADEELAGESYGTIHTYTVGFAALEASRDRAEAPDSADAVTTRLAAYTTPEQFSVGLTYLLEGIDRRMRAPR